MSTSAVLKMLTEIRFYAELTCQRQVRYKTAQQQVSCYRSQLVTPYFTATPGPRTDGRQPACGPPLKAIDRLRRPVGEACNQNLDVKGVRVKMPKVTVLITYW
jgi:hypothetical protein